MRDIRKAVALYIAGEKMNDIAAKFGITQPTVSYWVKRHGKNMGDGHSAITMRKRGRRRDKVPCDRDKEIVFLAALGVPAAHIGKEYGFTRARASYIVKTWLSRGYVPPPVPYKAGLVIRKSDDDKERYLIKEVNGPTGTVVKIVGMLADKTFGRLNPPRELKNFRWYSGGQLCEIVDDTPAS